jgi:hypothetical protein
MRVLIRVRGPPISPLHDQVQASTPIIQRSWSVDKYVHVEAQIDVRMRTIEWGSEIEHTLSVVVHEGGKSLRNSVRVLRMFCQADRNLFFELARFDSQHE